MSTPQQAGRRFPVTAALCAYLLIFLVLFPKGGVKVGGIPLTWGYMGLAFSLLPLLFYRLLALPLRVRRANVAAVGSLAPLQLAFWYATRQYGAPQLSIVISLETGLLVLPIAFLLIYPAFLLRVDGVRFSAILRFSMVAAALFGLFLFVQYPLTGHLLEIPFFTVNAQDYGLIEATKHINRGLFLKLISTYNNGNVYGVATLVLLPLYELLEPRVWKRYAVKAALLCTLSRTVWAGLIVDQLYSLTPILLSSAQTFPKVRLGPLARRSLVVGVTALLIVAALYLSASTLSFLFDPSLGGRSGTLFGLQNPTLLPNGPIQPLSEIVYASALDNYGLLGLLSVVLLFFFPVVLFLADAPRILRSPVRIAAFKGLMLYAFLCLSDGGIMLIPVLAFYWFVYMVFLEGWPGGLDVVSVPGTQPAASRSPRVTKSSPALVGHPPF